MVVEIPDVKHADGIVRITVYDNCRAGSRAGGVCIKGMHLDAVGREDKRIPERMMFLQTVQPLDNLRIFLSHESFRFHHVFPPVFRAERKVNQVETSPDDDSHDQQYHDACRPEDFLFCGH